MKGTDGKTKKALLLLLLLILTGPFAFLWLAFTLHRAEPEIQIEVEADEEAGEDAFEWKSIWEED
ncbi:hypothetical protein [Thermococcus sp.]